MSTTRLKPLLLPLIVQQRKLESMPDYDEESASSVFYTRNSSASDIPSPVTPTFSSRGHFRYPSSASSMELSFHSSVESPSSSTLAGSKSGKRSLPDVQEEPHEREEDSDMFEDASLLHNCLCNDSECSHSDPSMAQSSLQLSVKPDFEYDLMDGFFSDGEFASISRHKRRRATESPLNNLTTRFNTRFPSFSRRWRLRRGESSSSNISETQCDNAASRGASSRSSSISNSGYTTKEIVFEPQMPPTPTKSVFNDREDCYAPSPIDVERANRQADDYDEGFATTPLLPPLMMDASANNQEVNMLSPLQSPSVAEPQDSFSGPATPIDSVATPQLPGLPSPPLSTKPSVSSFHRAATSWPGHLVPSSEIPPIVMADPDDEWANKLGHANFTIYPEPYVPDAFDLEACRQLRANWDLARCHYTRHLVRTGEHYGVTSKAYKFTEEKWSTTDAVWRKYNDLTIAQTVDNSDEAFATLKQTTLAEAGSANVMTKIPSLNDPRSGGKFPQLGDEDIVGPMVQVTAQLQQNPTKKAKILKFFTAKFPVALKRNA